MSKNVRPWQGTVLGVLAYIGLALMILGIIVIFAGQGFISSMMMGMEGLDAESMGMTLGFLQSAGVFAAILLIPFAILQFFVARALLSGQKWTLILVLIFSGLGVLSALSVFEIVSLLINGFVIYLAVSVWNDPYYNKG